MLNILQSAIKAIKAGDKETGKRLLIQVVRVDPKNQVAWLWMTEVVDSDVDRIRCLQNVLKINPHNKAAKHGLTMLQRQQIDQFEQSDILQVDAQAKSPESTLAPGFHDVSELIAQAREQLHCSPPRRSIPTWAWVVIGVVVVGVLMVSSWLGSGVVDMETNPTITKPIVSTQPVAASSGTGTNPTVTKPIVNTQPVATSSRIGTEENPIVWAFVPSGEIDRVTAGAQSVVDMLQEETDLFFEVHLATKYADAIEAMCAEPAEAHMSSLAAFAYVMAANRGCAEAAMLSVHYGSPTYNGQFLVRADSGITDISQLEGKIFCRPDPLSVNGWVIPLIMLKGAGVDPDTGLAEIVDAGSHDAVAAGVYDGTCDVGATYVDARISIAEQYPDVWEQTVVIALEPDIPNDGVQFQTDVSQELRAKIMAGLRTIATTEKGVEALNTAYQWEELMEADDSYYGALRQILQVAGISTEDLIEGY